MLKQQKVRVLLLFQIALIALSAFAVAERPALADHPGYRPSYAGQYVAVATGAGVECWVAEWTSFGGYQWLYWNPVPCPDYGGDEVVDARLTHGYVPAGSDILHTGSRIERFSSGKVSTGMDLGLTRYGSPSALPAGWFASNSELWFLNGSTWQVCRPAQGWIYNPGAQDTHVITAHWGFAPCGQARWYASWSGGYRWTGTAWSGTWGWSELYLPCLSCFTTPGSGDPADPPRLDAKEPPRRPSNAVAGRLHHA